MSNIRLKILLTIIFLVLLIGINKTINFFNTNKTTKDNIHIYNTNKQFGAATSNSRASLEDAQIVPDANKEIISFVSYDLGVQTEEKFLIRDSKDESAMRLNTWNLQTAIDELSNKGGGTIELPSGTFYFSYGGDAIRAGNSGFSEKYAIRPRNNVLIIGKGVDGSSATILKPYNNVASDCDPGIDMFYFNNYADSGFESNKGEKYFENFSDKYDTNVNVRWNHLSSPDSDEMISGELEESSLYLINADFKDFVVDGEENGANCYTSAGKAFMINLFKDCDWDNVVVQNINATGFGMDSPINSTIKNCKAINCGRYAKIQYQGSNLEKAPGGSGFGIGTGTSNDESILIDNCIAINNAKFGFFFEHQGRFKSSSKTYPATTSEGYIIKNSSSGGNMYDFGGLQANDVIYDNVVSVSGQNEFSGIALEENTHPALFTLFSTNNHFLNSNFSNNISDVSSRLNEIKWAVDNGILTTNNGTNFEPSSNVSRFDTLLALYRYQNMTGSVLNYNPVNYFNELKTYFLDKNIEDAANLYSGVKFYNSTIVLSEYKYARDLEALKWGTEKGLVLEDNNFDFDSMCTRETIVTWLYKMAGSPTVSNTIDFYDVNSDDYFYDAVRWATLKGITKGTSTNYFSPNDKITKLQLAVFLYRYNKLYPNTYNVSFDSNDGVGEMTDLSLKYEESIPLPTNTFTKKSYKFVGWNTKADGTGYNYEDKETIRYLTARSSITLYAMWQEVSDYVINNYEVDETNKYINRITANTEVDNFTSNIILGNGYKVDIDTKEINNKRFLYTGGKTRITKDLSPYREYTNIVIGDINGDGNVSITDINYIADIILKDNPLSVDQVSLYASDYNNNNKVNVMDIVEIADNIEYSN